MITPEEKKLLISVLLRFARAFGCGAAGTMASIAIATPITTWHELGIWLNALAIAGIVGGFTGLFMAIDKGCRG